MEFFFDLAEIWLPGAEAWVSAEPAAPAGAEASDAPPVATHPLTVDS